LYCLSYFFWLLYCLSYFHFQLLITTVTSYNFSHSSSMAYMKQHVSYSWRNKIMFKLWFHVFKILSFQKLLKNLYVQIIVSNMSGLWSMDRIRNIVVVCLFQPRVRRYVL
jgi:hypothetical protein